MEMNYTQYMPRLGLRSGLAKALFVGLPVALACAYIAVTPSIKVLAGLTLFNNKRLLQIGLLLVAAVCVVAVPRVRSQWLAQFMALPRLARWGLPLALSLGLVSAALVPVPHRAFLSVGHYALLFLFAGTVAVACRRFGVGFEWAVLGAVAVSVLLYTVNFAVGYALHQAIPTEVALWPGQYSGFDNKRFFSQFQSWTLPLLSLPALLVPARRRWARGGLLGLTAVWWMLLIASGGRGTALGMAVALGGAGLLFRKRAWPWLKAQLLALGAGLAGYLLLFKALANTTASLAERDLRGGGRLQDYKEVLTHVAAQPWLGIGPMHTAYLPNHLWPTTHNAPLQFIVEWGVPAGLVILGMAVWGLVAWTSQSRAAVEQAEERHTRLVRVALTGSLLAAGVHAWVSGVVVMPLSQVMMAVVCGWAWARYRTEKSKKEAEAKATKPMMGHWLLGAFALAAVGFVLWGCYPEALRTNAMIVEWVFKSQQLKFAPRYWHQGIFGY